MCHWQALTITARSRPVTRASRTNSKARNSRAPPSAVRRKATDAMLECIDVAKRTGSMVLSLWFADGTNYPGQDDFRARKHRMEEVLAEVYRAMPGDMRM